MTGKSKLVF